MVQALGKDGHGYTYTAVEKDVCIKKEVLPGGKDYYSMVLVYVDDILCIHKDTSFVIDSLANIYVMKEGSIGPSDRYLGVKMEKVQTQGSKVIWETRSGDYFKAEIANL